MHHQVFHRFGVGIVYIFAIIFMPFGHGSPFKFITVENEIPAYFSDAVTQIIENYFVQKHSRTGFNIQLKAKCKKNEKFLGEVIDGTFHMMGDNIGVTVSTGKPIPISDKVHLSILLVDSLESLQFLYSNIVKHDLYVDGEFFIVLHSVCSPSHYYNNVAGILDLSWSAGIPHVNVLVYALRNVILLFHGVPFTAFHCGVNVPEIRNKFIDGRWQHSKFSQSKVRNLYGCPVVCATWEDKPYFVHDFNYKWGPSLYKGIEGDLLVYLSEQMNFTIKIHWMTSDDINQTIYNERQFFKKLFQSGVDLSIGAYHYKTTTLDDPYSVTKAYYLSNYVFVVSSQTDPYRPIEKLLLPFNLYIWIAIIACNIIGNVVIYVASRWGNKWKSLILGRRNHSPYYNLFVVLLGGPVPNDPKEPFSRFLLVVWTVSALVLRTLYQALLFQIMKFNWQKRLPLVLDDLKQEYHTYMTEAVFSYLRNIDLPNKWITFLKTEVQGLTMLKSSIGYAQEKVAILTPYEYFGYVINFLYDGSSFHIVPQLLFTQQLSIYTKKNSVFLNRFNLLIDDYINNGLMVRVTQFIFDRKNIYKRLTDESNKPLDLMQLRGAFYMLMVGLGASLCVFVGELAIGSWKMRNKSTSRICRILSSLTKKRRPKSKRFPFIE